MLTIVLKEEKASAAERTDPGQHQATRARKLTFDDHPQAIESGKIIGSHKIGQAAVIGLDHGAAPIEAKPARQTAISVVTMARHHPNPWRWADCGKLPTTTEGVAIRSGFMTFLSSGAARCSTDFGDALR